jgi:hypothetical protein
MNNFETSLKTKLNKYFVLTDKQAICYRIRQARFSSQFCDLLIDSPFLPYYCAIECKKRKEPRLNFKSDFSIIKNVHQLDRLSDFCKISGRKGYLFINSKRKTYWITLEDVLELRAKGGKSVTLFKDPLVWKEYSPAFFLINSPK